MKSISNSRLFVSSSADDLVHSSVVHGTFKIIVFPLWSMVNPAMVEVFIEAGVINQVYIDVMRGL